MVPDNIRIEGPDRLCLTCARAADRNWARLNQHKRTEYMREYRKLNREKIKAKTLERRLKKESACP
jgi:predicted Fe-S protein YdhL (DUF1289 family)